MEIFKKNGEISIYGYSCGYVNRIEKNSNHKELYKDGNIYHVRWNRFGIRGWVSFDTLKEAKENFKLIKI